MQYRQLEPIQIERLHSPNRIQFGPTDRERVETVSYSGAPCWRHVNPGRMLLYGTHKSLPQEPQPSLRDARWLSLVPGTFAS